ncbi:hypothetical protein LWI28_000561 [Acer negundo]|uniref:Reverse transcriptase domain-containing protein n=1 Tax=Acer negundo TaxID=4023 RepID=A0AAD5INJ0_ACENE|nr:hypothetical protein LWI28_000561 [Acer negundo]
MDAPSAPRPDGFSGSFYQRCLDVVGSEVVLAVQDFFITGVIFPGLNSSFIVLLPKLRDSISVDQFRLIILSNFLLKISLKILADRLARVAARIISPKQYDFIPDRYIEDCIALASDCVNVLQKKCYGGNLAMKIDICKAFDTLDWSFLCRVLQAFGFSSVFVDWIDDILRSSRLSVLFNGVPKGGTQKNLKHIMGAFRDYGDISGQLVNWSKSLSLPGRATLIRLVITGSFVHSFMIYKWSSSLLSLINRKLRNFLWTGSYEETKLVRVAWDRCCRPYSQGGFGLKDLRLLNDSLLGNSLESL